LNRTSPKYKKVSVVWFDDHERLRCLFFETTGAEQPNQLELGSTATGNRRAQRGDSWSSGSHTPSDSSFDSEVSVQDSEDERKTSPFRGLLALKQRLAKAKAEKRAALHAKREERRERVLEVGQGVTLDKGRG
jgi:hypothetical protein